MSAESKKQAYWLGYCKYLRDFGSPTVEAGHIRVKGPMELSRNVPVPWPLHILLIIAFRHLFVDHSLQNTHNILLLLQMDLPKGGVIGMMECLCTQNAPPDGVHFDGISVGIRILSVHRWN